ncbi:CvpA family protein [Bacteroides coprosuis]|uniref:CvpA family protein n=1 Tax=Bacteroides coprosuis TaxID=151276 RepID=UPI001D25164F|nr:CvpA family protein [Bacteroides coprosuis]HJD92637.1 CvpA family protein [Bacteroides coprosuis]
MQPLDIAILLFVGLGIFAGYRKGLLHQLASLLGFIVGLYVAKEYFSSVAEEISPRVIDSISVAQAVSFIGIWILVPIVFSILASLLTFIMDKIYLGWVNRLLGIVVGVIKYILLLSIILCVFDFIDSDNKIISETKKTESVLYRPTKSVTKVLFFVVKDTCFEYEQVD